MEQPVREDRLFLFSKNRNLFLRIAKNFWALKALRAGARDRIVCGHDARVFCARKFARELQLCGRIAGACKGVQGRARHRKKTLKLHFFLAWSKN